MRDLDALFADTMSRQAGDASTEQLDALAGSLISGARRKRRVRLVANGTLTVVLSLGLAAGVWAVMRPDTAPVDNPTPSPQPSISYALSEPTLGPVWSGSEPVTAPVVPAALADGLDPANLPPLVASPGPNYPQAHQMTDAIWNAVEPGWSLQVWDPRFAAHATEGPVNLYLASPSGTFFLVRELGDGASAPTVTVEAWSADPGLMLVFATGWESPESWRELQDLRTGEVLRSWGSATWPPKGDYTLMQTGFAGDRTVTAEFTNTLREDGMARADGIDPGGNFRVYGPDGAVTSVPIGTWQGGIPALGQAGADGTVALLYPVGGTTVTVLDLTKSRAHKVELDIPQDEYCSALAPGEDGAILAECDDGSSATIYAFSSDGDLLGKSEGSEPGLTSEFTLEAQVLRDVEAGAIVDTFGASSLQYGPLVDEYAEGKFAVSDWGGGQLVLYDRASRDAYVVSGDNVPGTRVPSACRSIAVLHGFVPGRTAFAVEWDQ